MDFLPKLNPKKLGCLEWNSPTHVSLFRQFATDNEGCVVRIALESDVQKDKRTTRTSQQNRALHLWLGNVAKALQDQGITLQDVVKEIRKAEIQPTMENLKETMWRPMQQALFKKDSSMQLSKAEVTEVFDAINMFLAHRFEVHVPFPSHDLGYWETAPLKADV